MSTTRNHHRPQPKVTTNVGAVLDEARRRQHAQRVALMAAAARKGATS